MKQQGKNEGGRQKKFKLFKPRKKKSVEEDAAIQYLQAQYDKVRMCLLNSINNKLKLNLLLFSKTL